MANIINQNSATLTSNVTIAALTAVALTAVALTASNEQPGFYVTAMSTAVAVEYNINPQTQLSAALIGKPLSAGGLPLSASGTAYFTYNWLNTGNSSLSSGTGTIIVDKSYTGDVINIRNTDRSGFLALLGGSATLALTANGRQSWGTENMRLRNLGYF